MKDKFNKLITAGNLRHISSEPIESKFDSICSVCKKKIVKSELISPYFEHDTNKWRHTRCLQLFFLDHFIYEGICKVCDTEIEVYESGYWSKHNGVWCNKCGENLFPDSHVSFSSYQRENILKNKKQRLGR